MREQNNPLIIKDTEHTEEFDHRDELLLTDEGIKQFIISKGWILSPAKMSDMVSQFKEFLAKAKQHYPIMFKDEAELIGWLKEKGWVSPEEAKQQARERVFKKRPNISHHF